VHIKAKHHVLGSIFYIQEKFENFFSLSILSIYVTSDSRGCCSP